VCPVCVCCVMCRGVCRMDRAGGGESVVAWSPPSAWWMPAPRASIGHHAGPQHQQHESEVVEAVRAETVEITRINCGLDGGGEGAPPFGPCTTQGTRGHPHHNCFAHTSFVTVCVCSCSSSCYTPARCFRLSSPPPPAMSRPAPGQSGAEMKVFSALFTQQLTRILCVGMLCALSRSGTLVRSSALTSPSEMPPVWNDDSHEERCTGEGFREGAHPSSLHPR
jgi:hypothetical protein